MGAGTIKASSDVKCNTPHSVSYKTEFSEYGKSLLPALLVRKKRRRKKTVPPLFAAESEQALIIQTIKNIITRLSYFFSYD